MSFFPLNMVILHSYVNICQSVHPIKSHKTIIKPMVNHHHIPLNVWAFRSPLLPSKSGISPLLRRRKRSTTGEWRSAHRQRQGKVARKNLAVKRRTTRRCPKKISKYFTPIRVWELVISRNHNVKLWNLSNVQLFITFPTLSLLWRWFVSQWQCRPTSGCIRSIQAVAIMCLQFPFDDFIPSPVFWGQIPIPVV